MSLGPIVTVPAEIAVADRLVGTVTVRMAGWLALALPGATAAAVGWPSPAPSALGLLVLTGGLTGAWATPGGRHLEAWLLPVLGFVRRVGRHTTGDDPVAAVTPRRRDRLRVRPRRPLAERCPRRRSAESPTPQRSQHVPAVALAAVLTGFLTLDVAVFTADTVRSPGTHAAHDKDPAPATEPTTETAIAIAPDPTATTPPPPLLLLLPGAGTP